MPDPLDNGRGLVSPCPFLVPCQATCLYNKFLELKVKSTHQVSSRCLSKLVADHSLGLVTVLGMEKATETIRG